MTNTNLDHLFDKIGSVVWKLLAIAFVLLLVGTLINLAR